MQELKETPLIPKEVYDNLPLSMKRWCDQFSNDRERDVFLISAIGVLSGCFSRVKGKYGTEIYYCNLFVIVVAPAGSGKRVMKYARELAENLHGRLLLEYEAKLGEFEVQDDGVKTGPKRPKRIVFLIPGNISAARMYMHLSENGGIGVLTEAEMATLGGSMQQEWGDIKDLLRNAFDNGRISITRKTENLFIEIRSPKLAIVLTGTPGQMASIISSAEDGLMSRFAFYVFKEDLVWRSQKPCENCLDLATFFQQEAVKITGIVDALEAIGEPIFRMSSQQFDRLDAFFAAKIQTIKQFGIEETSATVLRLALIMFRMAMVLTIMRNADENSLSDDLVCSDIDFNSALAMAETFLYHGLAAYNLLPKKDVAVGRTGAMLLFGSLEPQMFSTSYAQKVGKALRMSERSVRNHLDTLVKSKLVIKQKHGHYKKDSSQQGNL